MKGTKKDSATWHDRPGHALKLIMTGTVMLLASCGEKETTLIVPKNDDPDRAALIERAHTKGLHKDPEVIREIESLLIAKLKEQELQPKLAALEVTDEEAKDYISNSSSTQSGELQVAVLWFNTRGQQQLVDRYQPRLEKLTSQISTLPISEGFGQHAITHSEHKASRFKGGTLGWLAQKESSDLWQQTVLDLAKNLQPGELSSITANKHGLFLVRLLDRREAPKPSLASIKQKLLRQKRSALNEEFKMKN